MYHIISLTPRLIEVLMKQKLKLLTVLTVLILYNIWVVNLSKVKYSSLFLLGNRKNTFNFLMQLAK